MEKTEKKNMITVLAGTFPTMSGNLAKSKAKKMADAGIQGFEIKPAKDKGYICVAKTVEGQEEANKLIQEAAKKGISLGICR